VRLGQHVGVVVGVAHGDGEHLELLLEHADDLALGVGLAQGEPRITPCRRCPGCGRRGPESRIWAISGMANW
jgi:hypothetical protein